MQPGVLPWTKQTAAISIPFQGDCRPQLTLRPEILSIFISCGHTGHVHLWDFRRTSRNVPLCALCLFQWLPNEHPRKWFVSSGGQIASAFVIIVLAKDADTLWLLHTSGSLHYLYSFVEWILLKCFWLTTWCQFIVRYFWHVFKDKKWKHKF